MAARIYPLPGEQVFPAGIVLQEASGDFYAGSTTDGPVFRGNVSEPGAGAEVFLEPGTDGRSAAIGMKVDAEGRLFIAGGMTGRLFVYDTSTGELIDAFSNDGENTFVNDVTLTPDGSAYFADSMNPELYRVYPDGSGGYEFESFLSFRGAPAEFGEGFNFNGIAASEDGRYLVTVNSSTGELFRMDTRGREVTPIVTGGADLTNGDSIFLDGRTLYVCRKGQEEIVPLVMSEDFASGEPGEPFTDASFMHPTTIAVSGERLYAVNSQFDRREGGEPELPFNVSGVRLPR